MVNNSLVKPWRLGSLDSHDVDLEFFVSLINDDRKQRCEGMIKHNFVK